VLKKRWLFGDGLPKSELTPDFVLPTLMSMIWIRFNKRREDFHGLRQYNDYLEEVEDISE
jgi:hypothetical protein